jgi:hypothetical protein
MTGGVSGYKLRLNLSAETPAEEPISSPSP